MPQHTTHAHFALCAMGSLKIEELLPDVLLGIHRDDTWCSVGDASVEWVLPPVQKHPCYVKGLDLGFYCCRRKIIVIVSVAPSGK